MTDFGLARWLASCQNVDLDNLLKKPTSLDSNNQANNQDVIKWYEEVVKQHYLKFSNKNEKNDCPEQNII